MANVTSHPSEIVWREGDLPDVHSVPRTCRLLAWFVYKFDESNKGAWRDDPTIPEKWNGKLARIEMVMSWGDNLNPLRWCDCSGFPVGWTERVTFWAVLNEGVESEEKVDWAKLGL